MGAPAPARTARTARTAAPAPARDRRRSRSRIAPHGSVVRLPATAVGRTAGAFGDIADSPMMVGLSRGRLWIGVLGILLGGIVALNVWGLSLSASTTGTASKIDALERKNSVLRARVASNESVGKVQKVAAEAGFGVPAPRAINYLDTGAGDAARAAQRLEAGGVSAAAALSAASSAVETTTSESVGVDPAAAAPGAAPVDPAPVEPAPVGAPSAETGVGTTDGGLAP